MVYVLPELPRFGGRFVDLSQGQLSLFRYIVDAYLSGELVSGGDILAWSAAIRCGEARVQKLFAALNEQDSLGPASAPLCRHRAVRRWPGSA